MHPKSRRGRMRQVRHIIPVLIVIVTLLPQVVLAACSGGMYNAIQQVGVSFGATPLTLLWCLNEASGTVTSDYSGNGLSGTYYVAIGTTPLSSVAGIIADGTSNTAISFTGAAGGYVTTRAFTSSLAMSAFTVVFWYESGGTLANYSFPFGFDGETTANPGIEFVENSNTTGAFVRVDSTTLTNNSIPQSAFPVVFDGAIHMVAFGCSSTSTCSLSVDAGTYVSFTTTGLYSAPITPTGLFVGTGANTKSQAGGTYQDVAMFGGGLLSQPNLTTLYNCGHSGICPSTAQGSLVISSAVSPRQLGLDLALQP